MSALTSSMDGLPKKETGDLGFQMHQRNSFFFIAFRGKLTFQGIRVQRAEFSDAKGRCQG